MRRLSLSGLRQNLGTMFGLVASGGVITWILITDGVRDIAYALSGNLMPLYLETIGEMSYQQLGWLGSIFGICMMLVNVPAGWLADKKGEADILTNLGNAHAASNSDAAAMEKLSAALDLHRQIYDTRGVATDLASIGRLHLSGETWTRQRPILRKRRRQTGKSTSLEEPWLF